MAHLPSSEVCPKMGDEQPSMAPGWHENIRPCPDARAPRVTFAAAQLAAEKEHTRRGDELAVMRRALPWVRVSKRYVFDTSEGVQTLADLFAGRPQLLVYHFMFGPE